MEAVIYLKDLIHQNLLVSNYVQYTFHEVDDVNSLFPEPCHKKALNNSSREIISTIIIKAYL